MWRFHSQQWRWSIIFCKTLFISVSNRHQLKLSNENNWISKLKKKKKTSKWLFLINFIKVCLFIMKSSYFKCTVAEFYKHISLCNHHTEDTKPVHHCNVTLCPFRPQWQDWSYIDVTLFTRWTEDQNMKAKTV